MSNFAATLILREINFRRSNNPILTFLEALHFDDLGISSLKMTKLSKDLKFRAAKMVKMAVFDILKLQSLISRKIRVKVKS